MENRGIEHSRWLLDPTCRPCVEFLIGSQKEQKMKDWQKRVFEEKKELDSRLERLQSFLRGDIFACLIDDDQSLLERQAIIMAEYSSILRKRIHYFRWQGQNGGQAESPEEA